MKTQINKRHRAPFAALIACSLSPLWACQPQPSARQAANGVIEALQGHGDKPADGQGFAQATQVRHFHFPQDDGPHPEYQTEWWYLTGNLESAQQRHFGYQLTFFRRGLKPGADPDPSDWRSSQIYFAHFTLSDVQAQKFYPFERWSRAAIGLAGAQAQPFKVWLDNWHLSAQSSEGSAGPMRLQAQSATTGLDLHLQASKPVVLQGQQGLSQKSAGRGNASYYYSRPRLHSQGQIRIGQEHYAVRGESWLDREWSTSVLSKNQQGWDWFSLQLSDGRDLMLYQLRDANGQVDPFSAGTLIAATGQSQSLKAGDFQVQPTAFWTSPQTHIRYPSGWRISVPQAQLELLITPYMPNQELPLSLTYWEGAVQISSATPKGLTGQGYVELTGYTPR